MTLSKESQLGEVGGPTSPLLSSKNLIFELFKWLAVVSIVVMFLSLMAGVIVRYVLSTNLGWAAEVPNLFFPWLTMSAIVAAAARNEHIGVELIVSKLPAPLKKAVSLAVNLLAMVAFAVIAYYGLDVIAIAGSQRLPITQVAMSWAYWSVVIGFLALAIVALLNILITLTGNEDAAEPMVSHGEDGI